MKDTVKYDTKNPFTIANFITIVGFFLALYSIIMIQEAWINYETFGCLNWPIINSCKVLIAIILTFATDLADGKIARKWKQKSKLGAFLDRARDKFIICPLLYYMYKYLGIMVNHGQGLSNFFLFLKLIIWTILLIEGALILGGLISAAFGYRIESHRTGKLKMVFECATVGIWILAFFFATPAVFFTHWFFIIFVVSLTASAALAIASFRSYLLSWFNGNTVESAT